MIKNLIVAGLLLLFPAVQAADPLPQLYISTVRNAIEGRRVLCFAVQADVVLATNVTVTLAYGGTAVKGTDYTANTTIVLPTGLATDRAIFIPITATADPDTDGETIVCTIQASASYDIDPVGASASTTISGPMADSAVYAAGEPTAISVEATTLWTYDLHVRRPPQIPAAIPSIPVQPFTVIVEAAPGSALPAFAITVDALPIIDDETVRFRISATPPVGAGGTQVRFRLSIRVDVDGDQHFITPGAPTSGGEPSQDVFATQDVVLAVQLLGAG